MTLEMEKRFLLLLSSYYCITNSLPTTKQNVLDTIVENGWVDLNSIDLLAKHNRNELVWRNDFAFVRKHLAQEGFYLSAARNDWSISNPAGKRELARLFTIANSTESLQKITALAVQYGRQVFPFP